MFVELCCCTLGHNMRPETENDSHYMIEYPQEMENENGVVSKQDVPQQGQVSVNVKEVNYKLNMRSALAKKTCEL